MDPRDQLRPLLDGVGCTVCGSLVPAERIRILAHRDDLAFVELSCPGCGSATLGMLQAAADGSAVLDVAPFGELTPADEARRTGTGPITAQDVKAARAFLAGWDGDLVGLLRHPDEPDTRREPPASR
ncbi:MAG TPA: hypothetical protein VFU17_04790 [Candidatus Limnocylindrales bacterium]|nr:hypothetical protein [Candidatus Limnocylindrales bacterium]